MSLAKFRIVVWPPFGFKPEHATMIYPLPANALRFDCVNYKSTAFSMVLTTHMILAV